MTRPGPTSRSAPSERHRAGLRGALVERITQWWVVTTGRPVDVRDRHRWLDGPVGAPDGIGEAWIEEHASRTDAVLLEDSSSHAVSVS